MSEIAEAPRTGPGLSVEMRRCSAGVRVVTALMCSVLLINSEPHVASTSSYVMLAYNAWSGWLLWSEARERPLVSGLLAYWVDVAWACTMMQLFSAGVMAMMFVTLIHPVVLTTIGYGVGHGVLLSAVAAAGMLLGDNPALLQLSGPNRWSGLMELVALLLVPAAALLARPMRVLHRWLALIGELETRLDPRRGLEPICTELVERLRAGTQADVVALVLPSKVGAPAMIASREDGGFRAKDLAHAQLEQLLAPTLQTPLSYVKRRWWDLRPSLRLHGKGSPARTLLEPLDELARLLDVRSLHVVPLSRYQRQYGHFVIGYRGLRSTEQDLSALAGAAPELLRIIEQAALVDQLQEESASHERARIGRDLHDSAIQPYLGLKYAVECVALRIPADNPARSEVDALAGLVNAEVASLRELISGLRTGAQHGDNALVPAVRRQARRFALLFGIEVDVDCPDALATTRALAGALFHMLNEALNNIRKHTQAHHVWIALRGDDSGLDLRVRDDGGSVSGRARADFQPRSLKQRVDELGGSLQIRLHDGLNTELAIRIPL
jgi:signal transduction histidine kinase